jgi:hypothetical protein
MAQLFDDVFNKASIYDMLFFNVKSVLIHPTLEKLEADNEPMFERWQYLAKTKYNAEVINEKYCQQIYEKNAPYYSEFSKIIAITYATLYVEKGVLKRYMKKIVNDDEFIVLVTFMDELHQLSSDGVKSTPKHFPILCGHNILSHDIPLLIKKFVSYRNKFETNKSIPYILKNSLNIKPWESGIIDTVNVWKFNGYDVMPLMLISDFLGLKRTVDLLPLDVVSKEYWDIVNTDTEKALEFVSLQSATQTNLVIQLMNELRQL